MTLNVRAEVDAAVRPVLDQIRREQFGPWKPTARQTSAYTAKGWDVVLVDTSDGDVPVILPAPVPGGPWVAVVNVSDGTNDLAIRCSKRDATVNGSTSYTMTNARGSVVLAPISQTEWVVVNNVANGLSITLGISNVTGGHDIRFTSGDSAVFLGQVSIKRNSDTILDTTATETNLRAVSGGNAYITDSAGTAYIGTETSSTRVKIHKDIIWGDVTAARTMYGMGATAIVRELIKWDPTVASPHRVTFGMDGSVNQPHAKVCGATIQFNVGQQDRLLLSGATSIHPGAYILQWLDSGFTAFNVLTSSLGNVTLSAKSNSTLNLTGQHVAASTTDTITLTATNSITLTAPVINLSGALSATSLALGTDPADTGTLRLPNAGTVYFEASPTGTDVQAMTVDSSERLVLGNDTTAVDVQLRALTSVELYANGNLIAEAKAGELELMAAVKLDWASGTAALSIAGTAWLSSTATDATFTTTVTLNDYLTVKSGGVTLFEMQANVAGVNETINADFAWNVTGSVTAAGTDQVAFSSSGAGVTLSAFTDILAAVNGTTVWLTRSTELELQSGIKLDWASGTAALSIGGTNWLSSTATDATLAATLTVTGAYLAIGSAAAGSGTIRLENAATIVFEASPAAGDVQAITVDSSERVIIGEDTDAADVQIRAATSVELYAGGNLIAEAKAGELELTASVKLDWASGTAALSINGTNWLASTASLSSFAQQVSITVSGAAVASAGWLRGPNANSGIRQRNAGNTADVVVANVDASNNCLFGDATNSANAVLRSGTGEFGLQRGGTDYLTSSSGIVNITTNAHLNIVKGQALGAGAAATLGTIGGSGPATAAQNKWVEIKSNGTTGWVPFWV